PLLLTRYGRKKPMGGTGSYSQQPAPDRQAAGPQARSSLRNQALAGCDETRRITEKWGSSTNRFLHRELARHLQLQNSSLARARCPAVVLNGCPQNPPSVRFFG